MLLAILERALRKVYRVRGGFDKRELDISFLVKAIGGPKLLQKSLGLASVSTVRRNYPIPKRVASIGTPTKEGIHSNIGAFFNPDIKPAPVFPNCSELPGNVLMFNGVALETRLRYCPERDANLGWVSAGNTQIELILKSSPWNLLKESEKRLRGQTKSQKPSPLWQ